ncbi:MAG: DNA-binding protein [Thermosipho sp. (in: Bacteria)]|nr:DNA-binding protein [Thermosipho sp. (in: thermotogales)]
MKKLAILILILISVISFTLTISEAKKLNDGTDVIVKGIVTVEPGPFDVNIIFIQDETSGINIYLRGGYFEDINRGDLVEISGYLWTHRLNREIVIDANKEKYYIKVITRNNEIPEPRKISTVEINDEKLQGLLVEVEGDVVEIDKGDNRKVYIDDGSGRGMVFIRGNTGIDTSYFRVGMHLKVVGVLGRYQAAFELWPRGIEDIEAGDIFPPAVKSIFVKDEKLYIVFDEPIDGESIIDNQTIKIAGVNINSHVSYFNDRVFIFELDSTIISPVKIMVRFIRDKNGNKMGSVILNLDPFKDVYEKRVLFDAGHAQQAGNADWVIDGAYSNFADSIKEMLKGYVEDTKEKLTYELLSLYKVFIIPEPNRPFEDNEIVAILKFVENGGGLFLIADHGNSDRNGNGWDSPKIFNTFVEKFGFKFRGDNIQEEPIKYIFDHEITKGVKEVGVWAGSTIEILDKNVQILLADKKNRAYLVMSKYGKGLVIAIGDSSPFDDGTGDRNDTLHDGWSWGDDSILAVNIVGYLMEN